MKKKAYQIDSEGNIKEIEEKENKIKKKKEIKFDFSNLDYISIGFYVVAPIVLGVIVGIFLDNKLGTKPLITLTLILLGSVGSLYNLYRLTKK